MYNLLEYSDNYYITSESLWNYYRDKIGGVDDDASNGKSFTYKTKIIEKTEVRPPRPPVPQEGGYQQPRPSVPPLNTEVTIPLKYLNKLWRSFDLSLINCEVELNLLWSRYCVLSEDDDSLNNATSQINSSKLYIPVVTLSIIDNITFSEILKQGFKRTIFWNKYRSEITKQPKNSNLNYIIDSPFRNVYRLFVRSFKNGENDPTRNFFINYYH